MTDAPTTPSPERQPADAGGGPVWHRVDGNGATLLYTLRHKGFRRGVPVDVNDLEVRIQASAGSDSDPEPIIQRILAALEAPAPQAQPDARAVEALKAANEALALVTAFESDARYIMGNTNFTILQQRREQVKKALQALSAPAADDGWRPISDYDGCGPVLVSTAPESPKYLFSEPVSAFHDAGGTWRCLGSKGGMAETALRPTHFRPLPAPPVALHPAAPTDAEERS